MEYIVFRDIRDGSFVLVDMVDGSDYYKDERILESFVSWDFFVLYLFCFLVDMK